MHYFKKVIKSFAYAVSGLRYAWQNELNFRIEVVLGILAIAVSAYLGVRLEPILLISALVLGLELMNTAIEALVDLVSPEQNKMAQIAKDCAAASVMLAAIFAVFIAISSILPAFLLKLKLI